MPLFQLIVTIFCIAVFLTLLFFVLGYVILPLLFVFGLIAGIRWLYTEIVSYRENRLANGCSIKRTYKNTSKQKQSTVIDVDYTEVK